MPIDTSLNVTLQHMTADPSLPLRGSCECGACSFEVHTSPKARFRCHCLICQAFNGKPFADVVAVRAKDVVLKNAQNISFKKYRPPPNFNRGVCRTCGKPVVEVGGVGPFKLRFIPASCFEAEAPAVSRPKRGCRRFGWTYFITVVCWTCPMACPSTAAITGASWRSGK
jgi:hypothetical protein